ncbi:MAG: oligosaccharide flippase family protein [Gammaproteobacteria bacterium]|nr:oligosaccharide flippase family protein [Gammaproteobacteria bacterium]
MDLENSHGSLIQIPKEIVSKLKHGAGGIVFARTIGFFAGIIISALIARFVTPAEMGNYFLILNLAGLFSILSHFGTPNVLLKHSADAISSGKNGMIWTLLIRILVLALLSSITISILLWFFDDVIFRSILNNHELSTFTNYLIFWFVTLGFQAIFTELLRAHKKFFLAACVKSPLSSTLTITFITLFYFLSEIDLSLVLIISAAAPLASSVIAFFFYYFQLSAEKRVNDSSADIQTIQLVKDSFPMLIVGIGAYIGSHSDIWLISFFTDSTQVAYYGAAARLVILAGVTLTIANGVLPPFIAELRQSGDHQQLELLLRKVASIAAIPSVLAMLLFIFLSSEILSFVYGAQYEYAGYILVILSFGQLSSVLVGSCGYVLIMFGKNKLLMSITVVTTSISLLSTFILTHYFDGMTAVALAFTGGKIVNQILTLLCCKKYTGINTAVFLPLNLKNG